MIMHIGFVIAGVYILTDEGQLGRAAPALFGSFFTQITLVIGMYTPVQGRQGRARGV